MDGLTCADSTTPDILRVALARGTVNPAGQLPVPVHDAAGAVVNGRDLLSGGGSSAVTKNVLRFEPAAVKLTAAGHLAAARSILGVAVVGSTAYLVGGESPKTVDTVIQVRVRTGGTS